jgi:branched-chain amino acid transport system ATP-binding protein
MASGRIGVRHQDASMTTILRVDDVSKRFGGFLALSNVSCEVVEGRIHALIGPNGAGKSTLMNIISGVFGPTSGNLTFAGQAYTGLRPDAIHSMGIARNFQHVRLFKGLSVLENVMIGSDAKTAGGTWSDVVDFVLPFRDRDAVSGPAQEALQFVGLGQQGNRLIDQLTLVDQRRVEIARALVSRPQLLLLDEPAGGMNPSEVQDLTAVVRRIQRAGITVLLVEHHMRFVMTLAEWITVLDAGRVIADGVPETVRRDPAVISAYIGTSA